MAAHIKMSDDKEKTKQDLKNAQSEVQDYLKKHGQNSLIPKWLMKRLHKAERRYNSAQEGEDIIYEDFS